jgi:hypothetical protein
MDRPFEQPRSVAAARHRSKSFGSDEAKPTGGLSSARRAISRNSSHSRATATSAIRPARAAECAMFGKLHHAAPYEGEDAQTRLGKPKRCGSRRHDHVATECEFEATAHPPTLHGRQHLFLSPICPFPMIRLPSILASAPPENRSGAFASIDSPAACRFSRRTFL